jgi:hypothetical protein
LSSATMETLYHQCRDYRWCWTFMPIDKKVSQAIRRKSVPFFSKWQ